MKKNKKNVVTKSACLPVCDKCGQPVTPENDAVTLAIYMGDIGAVTCRARHLLPVLGCQGSPSRAQYLPGQPKDQRLDYEYDPENEPLWREAFRKMYASLNMRLPYWFTDDHVPLFKL